MEVSFQFEKWSRGLCCFETGAQDTPRETKPILQAAGPFAIWPAGTGLDDGIDANGFATADITCSSACQIAKYEFSPLEETLTHFECFFTFPMAMFDWLQDMLHEAERDSGVLNMNMTVSTKRSFKDSVDVGAVLHRLCNGDFRRACFAVGRPFVRPFHEGTT